MWVRGHIAGQNSLTQTCPLLPVLVCLQEKHIREDLRKFLPREDTKAPEKPAEAAFRQRM